MRRRIVLIVAVACGLLAAGVPAAADTPTMPEQQPNTLRVLSYNIHAGLGADEVFDLERTARTIKRSRADVVGLQEVDVHWDARSEYVDEARELARKLRMSVFFAPIYNEPGDTVGAPRKRYGVAILSRFPIIATKNHKITRLSTQDPNPKPEPAPGFAEAVVLAHGKPVHVYTTHLDYRPEPDIRATQVTETRQIMRRDGPRARQVLLGDFNAEPTAPELAPLFHTLRDTWAKGDGDGLTYPATAPETRIDYALTSKRIGVRDAKVLDSLASDHRPYQANLRLR